MRVIICGLLVLVSSVLNVSAQRGDRGGHKMIEVWKDMEVPPAPVVEPSKALETFKIAPGFRLELVASEPMVKNPVAIRWDADGRLWVVEMVGYMANVDGKGEEQATNGRISVLEDTNGDGAMDKSTIFIDGLIMPRAIALVEGGILLVEPPNLYFCTDTDGDLKSDEKKKITGFGRVGPVEHTDNALMPAIDNWMYCAKSGRNIQFRDGKLIERKTKARGQWGMTQDNYGRLFYNHNSGYLQGDWGSYQDLGKPNSIKYSIRDSSIHSIRVNPGINRGYQKNMLREDGRLARITAISGLANYRGGVYPDSFNNGFFIPEPAANALTFHATTDAPRKLDFKHETYPDETFGKREFLTSTDERFRPVDAEVGPDGCVYIVDLYHGILQHKVYVTTFLRKQIIERGLDKDNERGRIYRIVHEATKPASGKRKLASANEKTLVKSLADSNGWVRDTAQRLLVQQQSKKAIPLLKKVVTTSDDGLHLMRIHALWTLDGLDAIDVADLKTAATDAHPRVRITALAIASNKRFVTEQADALLPVVVGLKADADAEVSFFATNLEKTLLGKVKVAVDPAANVKPLTGEAGKQYARGKKTYGLVCGNCHQVNGKGLDNLAPTLVGSEWVSGPVSRSIRIALDGVTGPIKVAGKTYKTLPVMPGHRPLLDDAKIADVLTYVRHSWGNDFAPVAAADVKRIRAETADRKVPYSEADLLKVK